MTFDEKLEYFPEIPESMLQAANSGNLVPFIGAGVSKLAGCPSWAELADKALLYFVEQGDINFAKLSQLEKMSPKMKLNLACGLEERTNKKIDFHKLLDYQQIKDGTLGSGLYGSIQNLGKLIITTNYDNWLDVQHNLSTISTASANKLPPVQNIIYEYKDIKPTLLADIGSGVVHLHGSIMKRDSMVITTQDYLNRYANGGGGVRNEYLEFLSQIFSERQILFIGYGLEELEILEYVFLKSPYKKIEKFNHYVLQGFFSHEQELVDQLKQYYQQFNIILLPYLKDALDWHQLIGVLKAYSEKIPARSQTITQAKIAMRNAEI